MKKVFIIVSIMAVVYLSAQTALQTGLANSIGSSLWQSMASQSETSNTDVSTKEQTSKDNVQATLEAMQIENKVLKEKIANLENSITNLQSDRNFSKRNFTEQYAERNSLNNSIDETTGINAVSEQGSKTTQAQNMLNTPTNFATLEHASHEDNNVASASKFLREPNSAERQASDNKGLMDDSQKVVYAKSDDQSNKRLQQQAMLRALSQRMELAALSSLTK